ncbi:MAG: hypothetical protein B6I34_05105 [Anaerolineaceae bacterium 4572_32.1]|nr:MAG: hypothetical protein B6I34_05105 [Anaerolineaceae bacterium 4572_32.1]
MGQAAAQLNPRLAAIGGAVELAGKAAVADADKDGLVGRIVWRKLDKVQLFGGQGDCSAGGGWIGPAAPLGEHDQVAAAQGIDAPCLVIQGVDAGGGNCSQGGERSQVQHQQVIAVGQVHLSGAGIADARRQAVAPGFQRAIGAVDQEVVENDIAHPALAAVGAAVDWIGQEEVIFAATLDGGLLRLIGDFIQSGGVKESRADHFAGAAAGGEGEYIYQQQVALWKEVGVGCGPAAIAPGG